MQENFGDLTTADHKVLSENCESRNNHRFAIVVQDLATQCVRTTPQMTRFRGAKVCSKWLQEIDDHKIQSDYKYKSELQKKEFSTWYYVCVVTLHDNTTDTNDNVTTKTDFHTEHINTNT